MINAILFDLDGTLLDRDRSVRRFAQQQYRRFQSAIDMIPMETYVDEFVRLDARGSVWKDEVYRQLVQRFHLATLDVGVLLADFVQRFQEHCVAFPGTLSTLDELRSSGYALGIVTNGRTELQRSVIRALELVPRMDAVLISEAEGIRKPDPEIFLRAAARVDCSVDRTVYVGDNPVADVAGARAAGLYGIWKRDPYWPPPKDADAIIDALPELPAAVARIATASR
jgi:putative hydrolase of the HAD superfamily